MNKKGFLVVQILVFAAISAVLLGALALWGVTSFTATRKAVYREQAFHIAEAGLEYYRWHLAHNTTDYRDGTTTDGPYVHDYFDKDGVKIGHFTLTITPPSAGGTTVVIQSKGTVLADNAVARTLEATMAIASYARYAVLSGSANLAFGVGVDVTGPVLGNGGVRFDGVAHNIISSAVDKYTDGSPNMLGVHTTLSPADPAAPVSSIPPHSDVFLAGRQFPPFYNVIPVDFNALTTTLTDLQTQSLTPQGFHLAKATGNASGYHIVLNTNGTFNLYTVTKVLPQGTCPTHSGEAGWEVATISEETADSGNPHAYPANGIIFVEDNLWLDGQINNNRLTIAAGNMDDNGNGNAKNIYTNHSLKYTNYDGSDVLGVIAQNNITIGLVSDTDLRLDGAFISQGGRIARPYYQPKTKLNAKCSPYDTRNSLYIYGMIASLNSGGFNWSDGTGYITRTIVYDSNLYYNPPPSFPRTSTQYSILKWKEVQK